MSRQVNPSTLFHLVPANQQAQDSLSHPDNDRFVSPSISKLGKGKLGLEIGFHVPPTPGGRVITRLGRDTDLILCDRRVSKVHVAFEIHPETLVVLLSVRSKRLGSVTLASESEIQSFDGDYTIIYGRNYDITIASNRFSLIWREIASLKDLAQKEYQKALQLLDSIRPQDTAIESDKPELHTWLETRQKTTKKKIFREAIGASRILISKGSFGSVYKTVDSRNGMPVAVKVINFSPYMIEAERENERAYYYREVKALQSARHENIIECLGIAKWDSLAPEIFMSWRPGTLRSLAQDGDRSWSDDNLCTHVLEQILSALDYLASRGLCHRDVKPENILCWYSTDESQYRFQLCDFGLAREQDNASTFCGTHTYQAPELHHRHDYFPQSPKMDIWSLLITVIDVHEKFTFLSRGFQFHGGKTHAQILKAVRAAVTLEPNLGPMAEENPTKRASAAQMLVTYFGGNGLTTPLEMVPPLSQAPVTEGFLVTNQHLLNRQRRKKDKASHKYLLPKLTARA